VAARRRRVVWTDRARDALDEAIAYVAQDSPQLAQRLAARILEAAESLERLSERGRIVPELDDSSIRELLPHPYRIIYRVHESEVAILALLHEARDFAKWQGEQQRQR
jgi:plasmid stabilization system protein ParE